MFQGKMVKTGACKESKANPANKPLEMGDGSNSISTTCSNVEGDIFIKKHNFLPRG